MATWAFACLVVAPANAVAQARCDRRGGEEALRVLEEEVSRLAADANPRRARELLARVLVHQCFARAAETLSKPAFETAMSVRAWWDAGGGSWLWHYLNSPSHTGRPAVILPPDERSVLTSETAPQGHALRPLACAAGDESCGRETAGWVLRAEQAFAAHRLAEDARLSENGSRDALLERCARDARGEPDERRYVHWYACVAARLPRVAVLPLGRVRAPSRGWLVLRGRRGHYQFCDELRAYDLATGAAFIASSCGGLALRNDGSVDFDATDRSRSPAVVTGTLPIDALREAAWMILMAEHVTQTRAWAETVPVPAGLERRLPRDGSLIGAGLMSMWFSSAQTTLAWSWIDGSRVLAEGTMRWPDSYRAGESHAASLVRVAEAALSPGCPPAALPGRLDAGSSRSGVSSIDADPAARGRVEDRLAERLRRHRPSCSHLPPRTGDLLPSATAR